MDRPFDVTRAITLLEEAAFHPQTMGAAFEAAAEALNAQMFHLVNVTRELPVFNVAHRNAEVLSAYMNGGWHHVDTWTHTSRIAAAHDGDRSAILTDQELLPDNIIRGDAFFNEFCPQFDLRHFAAWTFRIESELCGFSIIRSARQGPIAPQECEALARIAPVTARAAAMAARLSAVEAKGVADGLELSGGAAIVLNHRGDCSYATRAAESLFGDQFGLRQNKLWARDDLASRQLAALSYAATRYGAPPKQSVIVPRLAQPPIVVHPVRVIGRILDALPGARAVLMLVDLAARPVPDAVIVKRLWGLTQAEAEVALKLATGASTEAIAEALSLQISTVRQTTKAILAKTDTHRQGELIALIAGMPKANAAK